MRARSTTRAPSGVEAFKFAPDADRLVLSHGLAKSRMRELARDQRRARAEGSARAAITERSRPPLGPLAAPETPIGQHALHRDRDDAQRIAWT